MIPLYDVERTTRKLQCADNPDGTTYTTHQLLENHWAAIPGLRALHAPYVEMVLLLQHGFQVTASLVLPLLPSLYMRTAADQPFRCVDTGSSVDCLGGGGARHVTSWILGGGSTPPTGKCEVLGGGS